MKTIKDLFNNKVDIKTLVVGDNQHYTSKDDNDAIESADMLMNFNQQLMVSLIDIFSKATTIQSESYAMNFLEKAATFSKRQIGETILYLQSIMYISPKKHKDVLRAFSKIVDSVEGQQVILDLFLLNERHKRMIQQMLESTWAHCGQNTFLMDMSAESGISVDVQKKLTVILCRHYYSVNLLPRLDSHALDWMLETMIKEAEDKRKKLSLAQSSQRQSLRLENGSLSALIYLTSFCQDSNLRWRGFSALKEIFSFQMSFQHEKETTFWGSTKKTVKNIQSHPLSSLLGKYLISLSEHNECETQGAADSNHIQEEPQWRQKIDQGFIVSMIKFKIYSPACLLVLCLIPRDKIKSILDDVFSERVCCSRRKYFIAMFATLTQRYYLYEDKDKLSLLTTRQQENIVFIIDYLLADFRTIEAQIIDALRAALLDHKGRYKCRGIHLATLMGTIQGSELYIDLFFFISSLTKHSRSIIPRETITRVCTERVKYIDYQLKVSTVQNRSQQCETRYQGSFSVVSILLFCMDNDFTSRHLVCDLPQQLLQYCTEKTIDTIDEYINGRQLTEQDHIHIRVDYAQQLQSLHGIFWDRNFAPGTTYHVCYYDIYDGERVFQAGVDEEGITLTLIQNCVDEISTSQCLRYDEDGKIYFDAPALTNDAKKDAARLAILLMFIIMTKHKVFFPIKEEIIGIITDHNSRPFSDIGSYYALASSENNCMKNMKKNVEAGEMTQGEYVEYHREMMESHHKRYIASAKDFLGYAREIFMCYHSCSGAVSCQRTIIEQHHTPAIVTGESVANMMFLVEESTEGLSAFKKLEEIVANFDNIKAEQFLKLVGGTTVSRSTAPQEILQQLLLGMPMLEGTNAKNIKVMFRQDNIIPTWQTCLRQITIGGAFDESKLIFSMENAKGFHLL